MPTFTFKKRKSGGKQMVIDNSFLKMISTVGTEGRVLLPCF